MTNRDRCRWCGRFVPAGTEPTTRTIYAGFTNTGWRTVRQMLCPKHAADWSIDMPWNREADLTLPLEVLGEETE